MASVPFCGARDPLGHFSLPLDPFGQWPGWACLGCGPGTKGLPVRFISSRFHVSIWYVGESKRGGMECVLERESKREKVREKK